jgi:hypothetical protein
MQRFSPFLCIALSLAIAPLAQAQSDQEGTIAPLPFAPPAALDSIKPASPEVNDAAIMTTHDQPKQAAPAASPFGRMGDAAAKPAAPPVGKYSPMVPFGRAEPAAPIIPDGPRATVAVPVVDVDSLDAPEAAPAEPVDPAADPAQEDPAEPTELTSPIFEAESGPLTPRTIVIRALNKVTAQAEVMTLKSNQMVKFGQLQITAITCQISAERSQTDYAALLDIVEKLPTGDGTKPIFRGWMYASSPSITALEHPVYDVTMVECKTMPRADKAAKPEPVKDGKNPKPIQPKPMENKEKKPAAAPVH